VPTKPRLDCKFYLQVSLGCYRTAYLVCLRGSRLVGGSADPADSLTGSLSLVTGSVLTFFSFILQVLTTSTVMSDAIIKFDS
jgi:hypothetical protein